MTDIFLTVLLATVLLVATANLEIDRDTLTAGVTIVLLLLMFLVALEW